MNNNINILVIDDEPDVLKMVERVLELEDYHVSTSINGQQALAKLHEIQFDLVITDIRMPGMDGLEVIRQVKGFDPTIEVIVLSGYATLEHTIESVKEGGAFHFMLKPLNDIDSFYHIVSQALEKRQLKISNQKLRQQLDAANLGLEYQVKQKTESLEERIKELELQKKKLTDALEKADLARQTTSEFLGIMSHELKTPLNIIMGNVNILKIKDRDSESQKYYEGIKKNCTSLSDIIDDLLLFSDVDQSKSTMVEQFNFSEDIADVQQILMQRAKDKNLIFDVDLDPKIPINLQ